MSGGVVSSAPSGLEQKARSVLARLSRAVQRASIYPPGHPAVAHGLAPLVDTLAALLQDGPVSLAVGRTRILVASGSNPPTEHESPWLASRLFDKGISAIVVDEVLDAQEISRLVSWLAATDDPKGEPFQMVGVRLSRFDGSRVKFNETDDPESEQAPAVARAWIALTASFAGLGDLSDADRQDPAILAHRIRETLLAGEGTGIADLSDRFVDMHDQLLELDRDVREAAVRKLAALVEQLLPELRGSLLAVQTNDDPRKVELVTALLDHLSPPVLHHIVHSVGLRMPVPSAFDRFLRKLARLSLSDPSLAEDLDRRFQEAGLPISLLSGSAPDPRRPFTELPPETDSDRFVPEPYQERLEELTQVGVETAQTRLSDDPTEPTEIDRHVARIARLETGRDVLTDDVRTYIRCLRDMAPRELARRGIDPLAQTADLFRRLAAREDLRGDLRALVETTLEFYRVPANVEALLAAIAETPTTLAGAAGVLLAAGGRDSARIAVEWFKGSFELAARERVAAALAEVEPAVFREIVASHLAGNRRVAEALAGALGAIDPSRAIDLALQLASNPASEVRRKAFMWLLATPLTSGKLGLAMQRALDDGDPKVVQVGLQAAKDRPSPGVTEALLKFIHRRGKPKIRSLQARAVNILAVSGPDAVKGLAKALGQRRDKCSAPARRLSLCMADALSRSPEPGAHSAARAWRTSLAGIISWVARTEAERE
jgi:(2Fe-2S) ferredoxin